MDFIFNWLLGKAKDYALRNWKTTLAGALALLASRVPALAPFKDSIMAAAVALVALLAKDADRTGTTAQPREPVSSSSAALSVTLPTGPAPKGGAKPDSRWDSTTNPQP